jgi:hypothetical protein
MILWLPWLIMRSVTVTLHVTILSLVLGCLTIGLEVPGRGLTGKYTAPPSVNGFSGWFDNWFHDKQIPFVGIYHLEIGERHVLRPRGG